MCIAIDMQPADAIKNFDKKTAIHNTQNNFDSAVINAGTTINYRCHFNPLDKWSEEITGNRKLYERLLQAENEKVELLKQLFDKK